MKTLTYFIGIIFTILFISGCTVEFKATEVEAMGTVSRVYEFDQFSFSERIPPWH